MALVASAYYTRRSCRRANGNILRRDTLPVDDPPEKRRREPTCAERDAAPVCVAIIGLDPQRMQTSKHWAAGNEYDWLGVRR